MVDSWDCYSRARGTRLQICIIENRQGLFWDKILQGNGIRSGRTKVSWHVRESVRPDYPIMVDDCWMALNVQYTIELAIACLDLNFDGFARLKSARPQPKFTTGEVRTVSLPSPACRYRNSGKEYTKYRFRKLIEGRNIDILQSDLMEVGGMTELVKIAAGSGVRYLCHASGPYSYHFVVSQPKEYLANSPDGKSRQPVFGDLFLNELVPHGEKLQVSVLYG
ncbi:uncharacterized protein ARMOST_16876 [Armillaria ostoyae]|uniref:Enolase C-terminal domain-containing protein n=1 Tax=Armillaria ostoyae TaxID=47428 RepID=A0A284RXG3_ARMOS|nr:uncharacterized protein ARMOST_16876 [Armillaria ostoyae]